MILLEKLKILTPLQIIAKECRRFDTINCGQRVWKVVQSPINRPIWSHWSTLTVWLTRLVDIQFSQQKFHWKLESFNFYSKGHWKAVWPDLAKFRHFGKNLQVFGKFLTAYLLFGNMLSLLWQIWYIIGQIIFVANNQILNNNLTIWSHCWIGWKPKNAGADKHWKGLGIFVNTAELKLPLPSFPQFREQTNISGLRISR